jgi:PAS domain-containing protein
MAAQLEVYKAANIEELTAAKVKQESLIATMADGAVLLDAEGAIVLANPTARRLFRWEGRNLEGNGLIDELPERLAMELQSALDNVTSGERDDADVRCSVGEPRPHPADRAASGSRCQRRKPQGHCHDRAGPHPRGGAECRPEPLHQQCVPRTAHAPVQHQELRGNPLRPGRSAERRGNRSFWALPTPKPTASPGW